LEIFIEKNNSYQSAGLTALGSGIIGYSFTSQPSGILADSSVISFGSVSSQSENKK
jgi:hypothetical protein